MTKIVLSGHILVSETELDQIRAALVPHQVATRDEVGCLVFRVQEDPHIRGKFNVYEEFVDQHAFEYHQQRVQDSDWGKISRNVQRFYAVKELRD